jgi:hypothetical protein
VLLGCYVAKVVSQIPTFRGNVVPLLQGWLAAKAHQHGRRVVFQMKGILNCTAAKSTRLLSFSAFSTEFSKVFTTNCFKIAYLAVDTVCLG